MWPKEPPGSNESTVICFWTCALDLLDAPWFALHSSTFWLPLFSNVSPVVHIIAFRLSMQILWFLAHHSFLWVCTYLPTPYSIDYSASRSRIWRGIFWGVWETISVGVVKIVEGKARKTTSKKSEKKNIPAKSPNRGGFRIQSGKSMKWLSKPV